MSKQHQFTTFQDQPQHQQTQIQQQWHRTRKQQHQKTLTRLLILGATGIGLIFFLLLLTLSHTPQHQILQDHHPVYLYIQTVFPHLKVILNKQYDTYETKMIKAVGNVYGEVVSWIQGNVRGNMKIVFWPNQDSGVNYLGVALGYYLEENKGGQLYVVSENEQYRDMTVYNMDKMREEHPNRFPYTIINSTQTHPPPDLVLFQNPKNLLQPSSTPSPLTLTLSRSLLPPPPTPYPQDKYIFTITKGTMDQGIAQQGKWQGYRLEEYVPGDAQRYDCVVWSEDRKRDDGNVCRQIVEGVKGREGIRNVVEFVRNKTVNTLFYGLQDSTLEQLLQSLPQITKINKPRQQGSFLSEIPSLSPSVQNYFLLTTKQAIQLLTNSTKPQGTLLVLITSKQQSVRVYSKYAKYDVRVLLPYNNNGCFYPPVSIDYKQLDTTRQYFLIIT